MEDDAADDRAADEAVPEAADVAVPEAADGAEAVEAVEVELVVAVELAGRGGRVMPSVAHWLAPKATAACNSVAEHVRIWHCQRNCWNEQPGISVAEKSTDGEEC